MASDVTRAAAAAVPRVLRQRTINPTIVPINDLIGSPDPLSNLRPVYYAPLFPSLHQTSLSSPTAHPYSLAEFPMTVPSPEQRRNAKRQELLALKKRMHAEDLEWRLTRYRVDGFNQEFWSKTNARFLRARDRYLVDHAAEKSAKGQEEEIDLSPFYATHLDDTKAKYAEYNRQLWKLQIGLLWPAVKAAMRPWQWAWAVKRAGGEEEEIIRRS